MRTRDLIRFLLRRASLDSPPAFLCRLLRLVWIALYTLPWRRECDIIRKAYAAGGTATRTVKGGVMILDMTDEGVSYDIAINGIREPFATEELRRILRPGQVVVDVGANIGYYALQESEIVGEQGKVLAIEPSSSNVRTLTRCLNLNKRDNTEVYRLAAGEANGAAMLNISSKRNLCALDRGGTHRDYVSQEEVQVANLDSFLQDKPLPDVIRMDVEGYEFEVLRGMRRLLERNLPLTLFIEMHFDILGWKSVEIARELKRNGFRVSFASFETHPVFQKHNMGQVVDKILTTGIGHKTGPLGIGIDDLVKDKKYRNGQVEFLEVFFRRGD